MVVIGIHTCHVSDTKTVVLFSPNSELNMNIFLAVFSVESYEFTVECPLWSKLNKCCDLRSEANNIVGI